MKTNNPILVSIKQLVHNVDPKAQVILYGSFARGDNKKGSDIDILILLDKKNITYQDEKQIKYPLYDLEFDTGQIISPLVLSKSDWELRHRITPFYANVKQEGIEL
jgi:predicted nucleotidyltransferase